MLSIYAFYLILQGNVLWAQASSSMADFDNGGTLGEKLDLSTIRNSIGFGYRWDSGRFTALSILFISQGNVENRYIYQGKDGAATVEAFAKCDTDTYIYSIRIIVQTDLKAIEFCCQSLAETSDNCSTINYDNLSFSQNSVILQDVEFLNGQNLKMHQGTRGLAVYNSLAPECTPDINCKSCSSSDNCTSCTAGFYLDTSLIPSKCLSSCPEGYRGTAFYTCEACPTNCSTCPNSSAICTACKSGYFEYTLNGGLRCVTSCPGGYGPNDSVCSKCSDDLCARCIFNSGSETHCLTPKSNARCSGLSCECSAGYYKDNSKNVCAKCSTPFCKSCPNDVCDDCEGNRVEGTCSCPPGYYGTSEDCSPCLASLCGTCSDGINCDTCAENAEFSGRVCVCKSGFYLSGSSCLACDIIDPLVKCDAVGTNPTCKDNSIKSGACTCNDGYFNLRNECTACSSLCGTCNKAIGCTHCEAGAGNDQDNCDCTFGYYESTDKVCLKCNLALCDDCDISSTCRICVPNATFDSSSSSCKCDKGYRPDSSNKYCIKCPYLCEACDGSGNCTQCFDKAGADLSECDCIKGYYFKDERCHACPALCKACGPLGCLTPEEDAQCSADGTSCNCKDGYYQSGSKCQACPELCESCTSSGCALNGCVDNALPDGGGCKCKPGFYNSGGRCVQCSLLCDECYDESTCKKCTANASIFQGICSCIMGYYFKDNECVPCNDLCIECTETGCSICKSNAEEKEGNCVCKEGYYKSSNQCNKCVDTLCKTCDSTGNICNACVDNATSVANTCTCNPGYYMEDFGCNRCPDLATSCSKPFNNPLSNLICKTNAIKTTDSLGCKCKDGFFFWANECKACPGVLCSECEYGVCTDCTLSEAVVIDGVCKCNNGSKYSSANNGSCIACEVLCAVCAHDGCLTCKPNASLDNSNLCSCDAGYFFDSSDSSCKPCNSACRTCSGSPNACNSDCITNAVTDATNGCVCAKSYAISSPKRPATCDLECPNSCTICSESGHECIGCKAGYVFWPEVKGCYSECPTGYISDTVEGRLQCIVSSTRVFEAILTDDKQLIKSNNGFTLTGSGVIPAYQRGWYFQGQDSYATLSSNILYGVNFSFGIWVYFDSVSDFTLLKKENGSNVIKLYIENTALKMTFKVESYDKHFEKSDKTSTLHTNISQQTWYKLTISFKFDPATGITTLKSSLNGVESTTTLSNSLVYDLKSDLILGSNTSSANYFKGFLAYFISSNSDALAPQLDVPATFPACDFLSVPIYNSGNTLSCESCPVGCILGCANSQTCSSSSISEVCTDLLCKTCATQFQVCDTCKILASKNTLTGQCSCVANATFDVTSKLCKCNFGYIASTENDRCIIARDYLQSTDLIGAAYSNDYTTITISFNRAILRNQFATCQSLFISESYNLIGPDATCILSASNNSIIVTLGSTSTFTTGDLKLNTLVLIGTTANTRTDISPLTVTVNLVNGINPTLAAVITAPNIISLSCNNNSLLLRGDSSQYLKRFGISYQWRVSGTGVASGNAIAGTASSLSIPSSQLTAGSLTVDLTIKNVFNQINSVNLNVSVVGSSKLAVSVSANFNTNKKRNEEIVIELDVTNRCNTSAILTYAWSYESSTYGSFDSADIATNQATYTIPAFRLFGPYTYTFKVVVTEPFSATLSFKGETSITLNIQNEELEGTLSYPNGEKDGVISTNADLIIDLTLNNLYGFIVTYTWTCAREDSNSCNNEQQDSSYPSKFTIKQANIVPYINYAITVQATTSAPDNRNFSKILSIRGIGLNIDTEVLDPPDNPSSMQTLVLFPAINDPGAEKFIWRNAKDNTVMNTDESLPLLVITPEYMKPATEYYYELTVKNSVDSIISYKVLLFTTNSLPSCDSPTISPANGVPLKDLFTFSVPGCTDYEDKELSYTFFIKFRVDTNLYIVKSGSKKSSYTTLLNSYAEKWMVNVCDSKYDCYVSPEQDITFASQTRRMQSSDILDAFIKMTEDPENIPAATTMTMISGLLDRETYDTVKATFDEYMSTAEYTKYNRDLIVSVYRAIINYQAQILENNEIIEMLELCYEMIEKGVPITDSEAREMLTAFLNLILSRASDDIFLAESLELMKKIFVATLEDSFPIPLDTVKMDNDFYYQRLLGSNLQSLFVRLDSMNLTLPNQFERFGEKKIYDFFIKAIQLEDLPMTVTYLAEVGYYERPNLFYYDFKSLFNENDNIIFLFEMPYEGSGVDLGIKCEIYSTESRLWQDSNCTGEISNSIANVTTASIGTMRLMTVEQDIVDTYNDEECDINPAAYAILGIWLFFTLLMTVINLLTSPKKAELYKFVIDTLPGSKNVHSFEKSDLSPSPRADEIVKRRPNFLSQFILVRIFSNTGRYEKFCSLLSLLTVSLLGFAILGALTYHYGDIDDNSEASFSDIAADYYPEDLKMVFIALVLVIPAILPMRFISKIRGLYKIPVIAFTILILIASIVGVLTMGSIYCQAAVMRWTLSYLIYTPLEFLIDEIIIAALVNVAGVR